MNKKPLAILAPVNYPWKFNGPRNSKNKIYCRLFLPLNKISKTIEGVTLFNPFPIKKFDIIHAFNRIPLGIFTPFIIGFESHLPRAFGFENTFIFRLQCRALASKRCRYIIAISEFAKRQFLNQHKNSPYKEVFEKKLIVNYPNIIIPAEQNKSLPIVNEVRLLFVGNHFGRKGGCVAVKIAEIAQKKKLPIHVTIVSKLETGAISWVDPLRNTYFKQIFDKMQTLENINFFNGLANSDVIELLKKSHFSLLPTFSDTFGFSAIESLINSTPVIATNQGALPEFIFDGFNGFLLPLEVDNNGEWIHISTGLNRNSKQFEDIFANETSRLAEEIISRLEFLIENKSSYLAYRENSYLKSKEMFCANNANKFWDSLYERALSE